MYPRIYILFLFAHTQTSATVYHNTKRYTWSMYILRIRDMAYIVDDRAATRPPSKIHSVVMYIYKTEIKYLFLL